jgi:predicted acyltransferase
MLNGIANWIVINLFSDRMRDEAASLTFALAVFLVIILWGVVFYSLGLFVAKYW